MSSEANESYVDIYRRLLAYVLPYWPILIAAVVGNLIHSGMQPVIPHFMGILVETIQNPEPAMILLVSVAPAVIATIQAVGQFMGGYSLAWVGQHVVYKVRNEVFQHVLRFPLGMFSSSGSGRIMSKIIYDAQQISTAGTDAVLVIIREGLTVIFLLGYLLYMNWKLTLILLTVGPVIAWVVSVTSKRFRKIARKIQNSMGSITQFLGEAIDGHQVVKIYGGQKQEQKRFEHASRRFEKQNVKLVAGKIASTVSVQIAISSGVGLIIFLYFRIMGGDISVSEFIAFITGVGMVQKPIKQLTDVNVKIQRGLTGARSLFELLDAEKERDDGAVPVGRARGDLAFDDVVFGYTADEPVLKGVSFSISAGETIALVGRSGAGKSTISAMLPRFHDPLGGRITLDGVALNEYVLSDLRQQVAMVSQKVVLFNDTVRNNVAYGELQSRTEEQIIQALKDAHAWEFVSTLEQGLDTEIGQDGAQLSGGQRQRLAIARALLKDAPILILDEATSALDTESEYRIQQALEHVMEGRTTLVIAHRLSTIEKADRILVLDQGRVVESGTHQELLAKNGFYTQLYRMNFEDS
ncbi:MAG: lipid A export permease/ATP-binding protein MsbA [Alcanivoracaceae bacterium]|jgi:subfamily B ATP-binding cassette protein MsbA|nr:lipid A export permease/ATP-binding protein MsbA [Alcanivoracaceae bacterium]